MRLHELTLERIEEWRKRRAEVGREKYGDAHLQRYGLADLMEELLDAKNILVLIDDRMARTGTWGSDISGRLFEVQVAIDLAIIKAMQADKTMRDDQCTDEQGGERTWWSEQARREVSSHYEPCGTCGETPAWCGCEEAGSDA